MAKIRRVIRCYHCGAILQSDDPKRRGYIPKTLLNDPKVIKEQIIYCENCFETVKEINNGQLNQNVDDQILKILDDARASDASIVYVLDLFSFNGTFKKAIVEKIKKLPVTVVATKRDLFPKTIKNEVFEEFIRQRFNEVGIKPAAIKIVSLKNEAEDKELAEELLKGRKGYDVYMIGNYTSGKTTVINHVLKYYENKTRKAIKTSDFPGTKTPVLQIPLTNSTFFFELPGLALDVSVVGKVEKDVQKMIIPHKEIKVTNVALRPNESIAVGGLASFSLIKGENTAFKLFTAEAVENKKIPYGKVDQFIAENYIKRSLRPVSDRFTSFSDYDIFEYEMENDNKLHDIAIEGLGWVSFKGKGQVVQILLPKGCALKESLSKLGN